MISLLLHTDIKKAMAKITPLVVISERPKRIFQTAKTNFDCFTHRQHDLPTACQTPLRHSYSPQRMLAFTIRK